MPLSVCNSSCVSHKSVLILSNVHPWTHYVAQLSWSILVKHFLCCWVSAWGSVLSCSTNLTKAQAFFKQTAFSIRSRRNPNGFRKCFNRLQVPQRMTKIWPSWWNLVQWQETWEVTSKTALHGQSWTARVSIKCCFWPFCIISCVLKLSMGTTHS